MKHGLYSNCTTPSGTMRCHLYSGTKQQMDALTTWTATLHSCATVAKEKTSSSEATWFYHSVTPKGISHNWCPTSCHYVMSSHKGATP